MMAQQVQNNVFVRVDFIGERLNKSSMGHNRLDSCQEDKKTQFEKNNTPRSSPRMKCSYIHSSLSKYKVFFLFFFPSQITCPFFMGAFPLYNPSILHPNLSLVDLIDDLLDVCPIQNLLEAL